jgi:hypothetical protein
METNVQPSRPGGWVDALLTNATVPERAQCAGNCGQRGKSLEFRWRCFVEQAVTKRLETTKGLAELLQVRERLQKSRRVGFEAVDWAGAYFSLGASQNGFLLMALARRISTILSISRNPELSNIKFYAKRPGRQFIHPADDCD